MKTVDVTTPTVTVTVFSSRVKPRDERVPVVVSVDAGTDVSVDVSDEDEVDRRPLADSEVRVDVALGLGVHRLVLPGVAVKEILLQEKPVLGCVPNMDDPPDGKIVPPEGNMPDDQRVEGVVGFVPVELGI